MSIKRELDKELQKNAQLIDTIGESINDLRAVRDYMTRRIAESDLTPTQQKKLEIYEFIYNQSIGSKWTEPELLDLIITKAKCKKNVAIHLLQDTRELFTTTLSVNKQWEYKRQLYNHEILIKKAEASGDYRSAAALEKNRTAIIDRIEAIETEIEEFTGHILEVSADPEVIGVKKADTKELADLMKDLKDKYGFEGVEDAILID